MLDQVRSTYQHQVGVLDNQKSKDPWHSMTAQRARGPVQQQMFKFVSFMLNVHKSQHCSSDRNYLLSNKKLEKYKESGARAARNNSRVLSHVATKVTEVPHGSDQLAPLAPCLGQGPSRACGSMVVTMNVVWDPGTMILPNSIYVDNVTVMWPRYDHGFGSK